MEQQLTACLGEGEIAEFIEDDEVEAGEIIGDPALAPGATFGLSRLTRSTVVKKRPRDPSCLRRTPSHQDPARRRRRQRSPQSTIAILGHDSSPAPTRNAR